MAILLFLHSWVRWFIVLVAVIALVKYALGWARQAQAQKMDRTLMSAFSGWIDLQAALGVIYLLMLGNFSMPRIEHTVTMIAAVIVAHVPMRWRNRTDTNVLRNNVIVIVVVIVLVLAGIASLPGDRWLFRF